MRFNGKLLKGDGNIPTVGEWWFVVSGKEHSKE